MSRAGVDEAVEGIREDKGLAQKVFSEGASALATFDLSGDEQTAIVDALRRDVEEAGEEVSGFSISWGFGLDNVIGVGRNLGGGESTDSGHEQWIEMDTPGGSVQ